MSCHLTHDTSHPELKMAPLNEGRSSESQQGNQDDREAHEEQSDHEPSAGPAWYYEVEQDEDDDDEDPDYQDEPDEDDDDGFQGMFELNERICRASPEICRRQRWPPV